MKLNNLTCGHSDRHDHLLLLQIAVLHTLDVCYPWCWQRPLLRSRVNTVDFKDRVADRKARFRRRRASRDLAHNSGTSVHAVRPNCGRFKTVPEARITTAWDEAGTPIGNGYG